MALGNVWLELDGAPRMRAFFYFVEGLFYFEDDWVFPPIVTFPATVRDCAGFFESCKMRLDFVRGI